MPLPAFDMYGVTTRAVGGLLVEVMPEPGFDLPVAGLLAAITPRTRLVFITSPNNPTGVRVGLDEIDRVAAALPPEALVFVDEAYHDFCGDTALPLIASRRNVIVGRTFAKGHGLAALRAGCLIAHPDTLARIRPIVPPYSLNVCAAVAACAPRSPIARGSRGTSRQVERSRDADLRAVRAAGADVLEERRQLRAAARRRPRRRGRRRSWRARGIFVRNRSGEPGCEGCVRITAGVVEHTERCLAALEEILCAEP